jgi:hypothetical protein
MAVIDDDLVRAELALTELRRVRTLPFERSLAIIRHLASTTRRIISALSMQQHNLPCPRRVPRSSAHDPATAAATPSSSHRARIRPSPRRCSWVMPPGAGRQCRRVGFLGG